MFKQLVIVLALVGAVLCQQEIVPEEEQQQQQPAVDQLETTAKPKSGLGESLLDLAIIGGKNAKRTYDDSKPTLSLIRSGLSKRLDDLRNNPTLKKGITSITSNKTLRNGYEVARGNVNKYVSKIASNPHINAAIEKQKPVVEQGKSKLNALVKDVDQKGRELSAKLLAEHEARQAALREQQQQQQQQQLEE